MIVIERINLLIGPNATGKSTILRAINGLNVSVPNWTGDNYVIELPNSHEVNYRWDIVLCGQATTGHDLMGGTIG